MIMACHAPQLSLFHNSQAIALPVQQNSVYQRQRLVKFSCQTIIATQPSLNPRVVRHRKLCISCCVPSHSSSDRPTPLDHKVDLSADKGAADARSPPIRPHPQAVPPAAPPDGPPGAAAPVPFYKHLLKQLYIATGALLVLFFLFNSFSRCLQIAKPFITDSPPAAVWLPRPQSLQQPATTQQHWLAAAKFASSSITATSRQIMRIPDSFYVQCTATLQQVSPLAMPCTTLLCCLKACVYSDMNMHNYW